MTGFALPENSLFSLKIVLSFISVHTNIMPPTDKIIQLRKILADRAKSLPGDGKGEAVALFKWARPFYRPGRGIPLKRLAADGLRPIRH